MDVRAKFYQVGRRYFGNAEEIDAHIQILKGHVSFPRNRFWYNGLIFNCKAIC